VPHIVRHAHDDARAAASRWRVNRFAETSRGERARAERNIRRHRDQAERENRMIGRIGERARKRQEGLDSFGTGAGNEQMFFFVRHSSFALTNGSMRSAKMRSHAYSRRTRCLSR